ncbi:nucleotidyltransferase [Asanoa sp. NPDC050611]|uniref:nucleotidyltransferase domain-containing protein n=1 Tax=Asanoa sp. NPDC050611 TaxID=3157098 RepID=UPI0033EB9C2E
MTIPADQIEEWARQGDSTRPAWTEAVLREALTDARRLKEIPYEIFLQGSYANDTNLRHESDVDLVVSMRLPFEEDIARLDPLGLDLFWERYEETTYGWEEFRADVLATLKERFFVAESNRCLDITDLDSLVRVPADVLPAIEFRRYHSITLPFVEDYDEGVYFRTRSGHPIVNYPKIHLRNGRAKNARTRGRFKQVVRVMKNARKHESAGAEARKAPSYFVECLLYNVDDHCFLEPTLAASYHACLTWLASNDWSHVMCQNEITELFGDRLEQWCVDECRELVAALTRQWEEWGADA